LGRGFCCFLRARNMARKGRIHGKPTPRMIFVPADAH
jgi:hypothetical protein